MLGRLNGWLILLAVACTGPVKDVEDTDDTEEPEDTEDSEPTGETGPVGPEFFEPAFLHVSGEFGWDSTALSLVDVGTPYGDFPSRIILQYGDAGWEADQFSLESDNYCVVELPMTQSALGAWVATSPAYWFGFEYDPADGLLTSCNLGDGVYDFDPDAWGADFPLPLTAEGWGLGVGEITPEWATAYAGSPIQANVFGGVIPNTMLPYGEDDYISISRQIDANHAVVLDGNSFIFLPAAEVRLTNNIATGWYVVDTTGLWTIGD